MRKCPAIIVTLSLFSTLASAADPPLVPTYEALQRTDVKGAQVILIADFDHSKASIRDAIAVSLKDFKKSDIAFNCLFLEVDRRVQPALDEFATSKTHNFDRFVRRQRELTRTTTQGELTKSNQDSVLTEALLNHSLKNEFRIFAADINFSSDLGSKVQGASLLASFLPEEKNTIERVAKYVVDERSKSFAETIASQFTQGVCKRAIAIMGAGHFSTTSFGVPVTSLQTYVVNFQIRPLVAAAFSGNCDDMANSDAQKKETCRRVSNGESISALLEGGNINNPAFALVAK